MARGYAFYRLVNAHNISRYFATVYVNVVWLLLMLYHALVITTVYRITQHYLHCNDYLLKGVALQHSCYYSYHYGRCVYAKIAKAQDAHTVRTSGRNTLVQLR